MHHKAFPIPFERTAQSADVMTNPALTQPWAVRAICSLIPKHRNAAGQETPPVEPLRRHSAAAGSIGRMRRIDDPSPDCRIGL
jgi:hypothetical protein